MPGVQKKPFSCQLFAFLENSPANLLSVPTHGFVCLWNFTVCVFIAKNDHITHQGLSDKGNDSLCMNFPTRGGQDEIKSVFLVLPPPPNNV